MYDFIAIDFEIANVNLYSACSLGLVFVKDLEIVDKKYYLIKPPTQRFDSDMTKIHGITYKNIKDAPTLRELWLDIGKYFNGAYIIAAHNTHFDMSVLFQSLKYQRIPYSDFTYIDSMFIGLIECPNEYRSLDKMCSFLNIPLANHHNALDDAIGSASIILDIIKKSNRNKSLNQFLTYKKLSDQQRRFFDLKPLEKFKGGFSHEKINIKSINETQIAVDDHVFLGKSFVFTGELENIDRITAMQKVVALGGIIKSGVSGKTDYLIVGTQDKSIVGDAGMSTKEKKAYTFIEQGKPIHILKENDFLDLI